ncbi:MAG: efflux RND transporter periplasmic adaptor subunit [Alistipes sp.]|jgi:RND family efflux transporter MFP subunit|nr:efflux RND transporter periplasmic adaptor subunit [Alistipes sp.]
MIRFYHSIVVTALLAGCVAGCREKTGEREDADLARQVFAAQTNPVEVMTLAERDFHKQVISNGRLEARRRAVLSFAGGGRIAAVNVEEGARVSRGEVLAALDTEDSALALERARLAHAKAELDLADKLLDFDYGPQTDTASIPDATMRIIYLRSGYLDARHALQTARLNHARSTLRAPFAGKVANVKGKAWEQAAGEFCTVIDDATFSVKFSVLETEVGFVAVGRPVKVYSFNDPENIVTGRITAINPTVDEHGQIQVTAAIPGNGKMIDGMNVRVMAEQVVPRQLVVPKSAVVIRDGLEVLFRVVDGKSVWTYVHTTAANSTEYVVAPNTGRGADLSPGDAVITSGNLNLGGGTPVEIAE